MKQSHHLPVSPPRLNPGTPLNPGGGKEGNPRRDRDVPTTHPRAHLRRQVTRQPTPPAEPAGLPLLVVALPHQR